MAQGERKQVEFGAIPKDSGLWSSLSTRSTPGHPRRIVLKWVFAELSADHYERFHDSPDALGP